MNKNKLLVLVGRPGCGKSTLIEKFLSKNQKFKFFDVYNFLKQYKPKDTTVVPEKFTLKAYQDMYKEIFKEDQSIILELGTNHHQFNFDNLKELAKKFKINLVFCELDIEECANRHQQRITADGSRDMGQPAFERRLKRVFPDNHKKLADQFKFPYQHLDMCLPFEDRIKFLERIINL